MRLSGGEAVIYHAEQVEFPLRSKKKKRAGVYRRQRAGERFQGRLYGHTDSGALRVSGLKRLSELELKGDEVYLNLNGLPAGEHTLPLSVELPAGVRVLEPMPARVRVRITKSGN